MIPALVEEGTFFGLGIGQLALGPIRVEFPSEKPGLARARGGHGNVS